MNWSLACVSNDEAMLRSNLLESPGIRSAGKSFIKRGFRSASLAYNEVLAESTADVVVFCHQDVYLPQGWDVQVSGQLEELDQRDSQWAVAGAFGLDASGGHVGLVYCAGMQRVLGAPKSHATPVRALDEVLLIVRRSSGVKFDSDLAGFHLYGTDICLTAEAANRSCYAVHSPVVHNTNKIALLPQDYWRAYFKMRTKWRSKLPVHTPCISITRWNFPMARYIVRSGWRPLLGAPRVVSTRTSDPAALASKIFNML